LILVSCQASLTHLVEHKTSVFSRLVRIKERQEPSNTGDYSRQANSTYMFGSQGFMSPCEPLAYDEASFHLTSLPPGLV